MAYDLYTGNDIGTIPAAADLSAKQYYLLKMTATGLNLAGAGEAVDGALQNTPVSGEAVDMREAGITKVVAGAAIAVGANVSADASGKGVTSASGNYIFGKALEAAAADGDIISVLISKVGRLA